jgi:hypothetical protein
MSRRFWRLQGFTWVSLLASFVGGSCSATRSVEIPTWIDTPPTTDSHLYATGNFWGSLNPADNEKNAVAAAMKNLGAALQSQVGSWTKVSDFGSDRTGRGDSVISSKVTVENVEQISTWRDDEGVRGPKGCVWVLVRTTKPRS